MDGKTAGSAALRVMALEFALTFPAVFPMTALYRWVYVRTHLDD
jgi:hypothetical protein